MLALAPAWLLYMDVIVRVINLPYLSIKGIRNNSGKVTSKHIDVHLFV